MTEYWGYHLLVNCSNCDRDFITDRWVHNKFLEELVEAIDMVAYGKPVLAHFATHDPSKGGFTLMQMIETSSITGHFVDETLEAYIDVFSCKEFDLTKVHDVIQKWYRPGLTQMQMIYRKAY